MIGVTRPSVSKSIDALASYPGLHTPGFFACSTNTEGRPGKTDHVQ